MFLERKQDLSIFFWLKDAVLLAFPTVTVVDGYPEEDLIIPSVAVVNQSIILDPFELGNRTGVRIRAWNLDVYASNKAQRDELSSIIINEIESNIPVLDFDEGFPPTVSPTQLGVLIPRDVTVIPIRIFPELVEKLYWRSTIRFMTDYSED